LDSNLEVVAGHVVTEVGDLDSGLVAAAAAAAQRALQEAGVAEVPVHAAAASALLVLVVEIVRPHVLWVTLRMVATQVWLAQTGSTRR
jgi:hypothetical protein